MAQVRIFDGEWYTDRTGRSVRHGWSHVCDRQFEREMETMKNLIKNHLTQLGQRLAEVPSELRTIPSHPYRVAVALAVLALLVYVIYFAPIVPDLKYWVLHGTFPRR